jgi:hypothetical protein
VVTARFEVKSSLRCSVYRRSRPSASEVQPLMSGAYCASKIHGSCTVVAMLVLQHTLVTTCGDALNLPPNHVIILYSSTKEHLDN